MYNIIIFIMYVTFNTVVFDSSVYFCLQFNPNNECVMWCLPESTSQQSMQDPTRWAVLHHRAEGHLHILSDELAGLPGLVQQHTDSALHFLVHFPLQVGIQVGQSGHGSTRHHGAQVLHLRQWTQKKHSEPLSVVQSLTFVLEHEWLWLCVMKWKLCEERNLSQDFSYKQNLFSTDGKCKAAVWSLFTEHSVITTEAFVQSVYEVCLTSWITVRQMSCSSGSRTSAWCSARARTSFSPSIFLSLFQKQDIRMRWTSQ